MSWIMTHVYDATKDTAYLIRAVKIWRSEIDFHLRLESFHRVAELYWNIAKAEEQLGNYLESATGFEEAAKYYVKAGEKHLGLGPFYLEYSQYMSSWSEFEQGKQAHVDTDYLGAKEHFENVASRIGSTKRWSYLVPDFLAWGKLEEAEAHSRREKPKEAIESFSEAIDLFEKSKASSQKRLDDITSIEGESRDAVKAIVDESREKEQLSDLKPSSTKDAEEKESLLRIIEAGGVRVDYCRGRIALEEALVLLKNGETMSSSRKYGQAAKIFAEIGETSEDRGLEMQPFVCLGQAWQCLVQAEAEASPEKYHEAMKLFENMKDKCSDEKTKRLIQGHTFFCKALEAGARFEEKKDVASLQDVIRNFSYAADDYLKANYVKASECARANQRLFEGYSYMENASKEVDPAKRVPLYALAEKLLESSAQSYEKAEYLDKAAEVNRILGRVREEREIAALMTSVLKSSSMVSPVEAYPVPLPTIESAIGLDVFDSAEIQAVPDFHKIEFLVGEEIQYDIRVFNAGKSAARLLRIEDAVQKGFKVSVKPEWAEIEKNNLNCGMRTVKPGSMEKISLVIVSQEKGEYVFEPRIIYSDPKNELMTCKTDKKIVTVKELGISGWLRGPRH